MAFEYEQQQALRILEGIELGTMGTAESYGLLRDADPTLVYFILTWLRERYRPGQPAAEAITGRVVEICRAHPDVTQQFKNGQSDPVVSWFEDAYTYRDLDARGFIALVVEKLEG